MNFLRFLANNGYHQVSDFYVLGLYVFSFNLHMSFIKVGGIHIL